MTLLDCTHSIDPSRLKCSSQGCPSAPWIFLVASRPQSCGVGQHEDVRAPLLTVTLPGKQGGGVEEGSSSAIKTRCHEDAMPRYHHSHAHLAFLQRLINIYIYIYIYSYVDNINNYQRALSIFIWRSSLVLVVVPFSWMFVLALAFAFTFGLAGLTIHARVEIRVLSEFFLCPLCHYPFQSCMALHQVFHLCRAFTNWSNESSLVLVIT